VRQAREGLGLSREGLAFKAGLSLRSVERIEAGDTNPHRATVRAIAAALECDPADLAPAEAA
jgi:transcriptional regulator with XRE-family HTH domain